MNLVRPYFDEKTQADIAQVIKLWQTAEPGATPVLNRLKRRATKDHDNDLLGFVWFHFADLYYYREPDYAAFKKSISNAIRTLMMSNETELLARAYNFVALDAANHGSYDVAYNYYMTSLKICENLSDAVVPGIVYANLGQLFNELGFYDLAKSHLRKGIRIIKDHPEDGKYYRNLINMIFQDGMTALAMDRFADVENTFTKIRKLMDKFEEADEGELTLPLSFIKVRVAIGHGDFEEADRLMDDMVASLKTEPQLYDVIDDVFTFLRYLIAHKHLRIAKRIIDAIENKIETSNITHIMLMFSDILVSYYEAAGNNRMVIKHLRAQHALSQQQRADQKQLYRFSIDLIHTISGLQEEQERILEENAILQVQAQTDALTGVPNRHAMNKALVNAFERAYHDGTVLGVEILDIDFFKEYNDTYGHRMGDVCLEIIADELLRLSRDKNVFCARYGGDEFVVIYENLSEREILKRAQALETMLASHRIRHEGSHTGYVTISQGICVGVPKKKNKLWDFLENADAALYALKKGRTEHKNNPGIRVVQIPESFG